MLLLSRLLQHVQQRASYITFCFPMKNKRILKRWVCVIRWATTPPPRCIVTDKLIANISSTQREDICILMKFQRWLYQATKEAWEQLKKASKISICKCGRWACKSCRYYTVRSWHDRVSVHLRFHWGLCMVFRGSPISHFLLGRFSIRRDPPALRPKSPGEVGVLGNTISGLWESAGGRTLAPRANCSYDNCDRLIAQTCGSTSCRLPSLLLKLIWSCQRWRLNFVQVQTFSFCVDKIFAVANILSAVIFGEHARCCWPASLGEEPVTIVVTTVRSWSERPSTRRPPANGHAETSVEAQVGQRSIEPRAHRPHLQINILEASFRCFPSFVCCLVKSTMELRQNTNVFALRWRNVCYKFMCEDSAGGGLLV